MITLDAVRAAVLSDQPEAELDRLVRAEQAAGRKVRDITTDMEKLRDAIWSATDLSEDSQDAFGDTLDALWGNCRREYQYLDPPSTSDLEQVRDLVRRLGVDQVRQLVGAVSASPAEAMSR